MGNLKRPNEFEELPSGEFYRYHVWGYENKSFKETIELAQKYAWNAAIRWAAENAKIANISTQHITGCITTQYTIDEQSILNGLIDD